VVSIVIGLQSLGVPLDLTPFPFASQNIMPPQSASITPLEAVCGCVSRATAAMIAPEAEVADVIVAGLRELVRRLPETRGAMVANQQGRDWRTVAVAGDPGPLPTELIADAIDSEAARGLGNHIVFALRITPAVPHVLVLRTEQPRNDRQAGETRDALAEIFETAARTTMQLTSYHRRCDQLRQMLKIAAQWSGEQNVDQLLEAIAATAAQVMGAQRATIFLWDRKRHKLIGRPAMGVEGNQLEVDDSAGIVGAVLQSGQPRRWHAGDDFETEINRTVDRQLNFRTESLLAVPMWDVIAQGNNGGGSNSGGGGNSGGDRSQLRQMIGVFELINCLGGQFSPDDEESLTELATQAAAAIQSTQMRQSLIANRDRLVDTAADSARVVGQHQAMVSVRNTAGRVAETDLSVLILGENGTGKEVLARSIHFGSPRKHQPFIAVNCAALVETLLESELFGHEKGAFTDAHQTRPGKFELADGGTLFLDEIGDLSHGGQSKLLRALEEKKIVRVGGSATIPVDVRVIAATNQPLVEMVRDKRFREDLFFRLNVVTLNLPPLRMRGDDIVTLAEHFLEQFAQQVGRKLPTFSAAAKNQLLGYSWPGNIRELRNLVERVAYLCAGEVITPDDLALNTFNFDSDRSVKPANGDSFSGKTLADATREFQIAHIDRAIDSCRGNITDAAGRLGLHRSNLYRKMRQLGFDPDGEPE
jgi:transcriptional regulator with GAF, ATPase, and Fis domain